VKSRAFMAATTTKSRRSRCGNESSSLPREHERDARAYILQSGFSGRELEADLSFRGLLWSHQFLDGVDEVLDGGVVGFQAAV